MKRFFEVIFSFIDRITDDKLGVYAAQASFFLVFSVTPFAMLLITLAKYFIPVNIDNISTEIYNYIPSDIASFIVMLINDAFSTSLGLISASAVSALWLASKGIMALYLGLNNIFQPQKKPNYFYARGLSLVYTIIFIAAIVLTIVVFGFERDIVERFPNLKALSSISSVMRFKDVLFMAFLTILFASFYKFLPNNGSFLKQIPGAAIAAFSWIVFSYIYSIYIEHFSRYSYVYGSLTAIVLLMLWLYICMNIFLYGAEINKLRDEKFFSKK